MKNYFKLKLILIFLIGSFQGQSQIDFKFNPVFALLDIYKGGLEFQVNPNVGLETEVVFSKERRRFLILHGKYYFKPYYGTDVIYLGIIAGGGQKGGESGVGVGVEAGIKTFGKRNLFCEFSFGVHSAIKKVDIPVYFRLMVGYRFLKKKN